MLVNILKSKTMNFGTLLVVAGLLEHNMEFISNLVPEEYRGLAVSLIGASVWALRWITTKPIAQK